MFLCKLWVEIRLNNKCFCSGKEKDIYSEKPAVSRMLLVLLLERSIWDNHPYISALEQEKLNTHSWSCWCVREGCNNSTGALGIENYFNASSNKTCKLNVMFTMHSDLRQEFERQINLDLTVNYFP